MPIADWHTQKQDAIHRMVIVEIQLAATTHTRHFDTLEEARGWLDWLENTAPLARARVRIHFEPKNPETGQ